MSAPRKESKNAHFPSYGDLVQRLLPSAAEMGFFLADGRRVWSSQPASGEHLDAAVRETLHTGQVTRRPHGERLIFALPLQKNDDTVGYLALAMPGAQAGTTLEQVENSLAPVMTVLAHELGARPAASKSKVLTERTEELEWLFAVTANLRLSSSDSAAVENLLAAAVERMGAAFGGLAIPEKRLNVTYMSQARSDSTAAHAYGHTHPHLMSYVQRQQRPLVLNKPPSAQSDLGRHKIFAVPVTAHSGKVAGLIAFFKPATGADFDRREQYLGRHIAKQIGALLDSQYDLATGLYTRTAFEQQVNQFLDTNAAGAHSLVYIDIDQLHVVNETFGYETGDEVIVRIADLLHPPLLPSDAIAARIAGDRFVVFLPGHEADRAQDCAVALQKEAAHIAAGFGAQHVNLSLSCGIARLPNVEQAVARGIAAAELACKTAKERGRNRSEVYLDIDESMMQRRTDITGLGRLRLALDEGRLRMFAQRILPVRSFDGVGGMECLVRMIDEDGAIVSPAAFMSAAQRYQLLKQVDEWVIKNTLETLSAYASTMFHSGLYASINISGQSLSDASFLERVESWVRDSNIPPGLITFEITETAAVSNLPRADRLMRGLRRMGCRFALDDFGTGVNSLSYLKSLQVDRVKIDGSFVRDIDSNPRSEAMVRAVVQLASSLDIDCVAEYVASEAIYKKVRTLGVTYVQGHYLHAPEPLTSVLEACSHAESQRIQKMSLHH